LEVWDFEVSAFASLMLNASRRVSAYSSTMSRASLGETNKRKLSRWHGFWDEGKAGDHASDEEEMDEHEGEGRSFMALDHCCVCNVRFMSVLRHSTLEIVSASNHIMMIKTCCDIWSFCVQHWFARKGWLSQVLKQPSGK